jgi:hypothetical protein
MAKVKTIWEDDKLSKEGSCAVCKKCRIHNKSGRCMFGGPFLGYAKVDHARRRRTEEETEGSRSQAAG